MEREESSDHFKEESRERSPEARHRAMKLRTTPIMPNCKGAGSCTA